VVTYREWPKNFSPGTYVDMAPNGRCAIALCHPNCYLLKNQAIWTNDRARVNYYPVGVRHQQADPDLAVQWDVCTTNRTPDSVTQDCKPFSELGYWSPPAAQQLIVPNRAKQLLAWIPFVGTTSLTPCVSNRGRNWCVHPSLIQFVALVHRSATRERRSSAEAWGKIISLGPTGPLRLTHSFSNCPGEVRNFELDQSPFLAPNVRYAQIF
jgi:hypothetical protein